MSWHGLDVATQMTLWNAQDRRCALCLRPLHGPGSGGAGRDPHLDHRHSDGLIRGYLCEPCNRKLGFDHEPIEWYKRAAAYLEYPPAMHLLGALYIPGSIGADRAQDR